MKNNKKVVAVVVTAVAITGSASALANASSAKAKSVAKITKTNVTTVTRTFNLNGMGAMGGDAQGGMPGGMRGRGGDVQKVLSDLVTKGTITADESKAVTDAWSALELAKRNSNSAPTPRTPGTIDPELTQALSNLVSSNKLSAEKSKAITDAVNAAEAEEAANRPAPGTNGMPFGGPRGGFMNPNKDSIITSTLGIDATTLHNRLAAGESLASIAGSKKDALIAALVADETKQIDAAVTAGKLTAAQATTLKANLSAHITTEVNETRPAMGAGPMGGFDGHGRGHGHGMMGGANGAANGIPAPGQTSQSKN